MGSGQAPGAGLAASWRRRALAPTLVGLLVVSAVAGEAQEIVQAVVLDLTVLEVHLIVAGTRGDEEVRCLLRDRAGRVRSGGARPVGTGLASGRTTVLSIPLPLLDPHEAEFAVELVRGGAVLDRTEWRPLRRAPSP